MENVALKDLKKDLSYWAEMAAQGSTVQVTKYNRPYIVLTKSPESGLYQGKDVGQRELQSALRQASKGKWLKFLQEDRDQER